MKRFLNDERAENPLEVGIYVLAVIILMGFIMFGYGAFIDMFVSTITTINITLSPWGQEMMTYIIDWAAWLMAIPMIFIVIVFVWGIKAVLKKHDYTTGQGQQAMNYEEEI